MPAASLDRQDIAAEAPADRSASTNAVTTRVFSSFAEAAPVWRRLATSGHLTPYQSLDFTEAYSRLVDTPDGRVPVLILLSDAAGVPQLLLPLSISRLGPIRVASFIGGKHSNYNMPVCAGDPVMLDASTLRAALRDAGRKAGIDLFRFSNQPLDWEGFSNPFARLGGQPSPSAAYRLALSADGEALLRERLSKETRKKLRYRESKLAQVGPLSYRRAQTPHEARAVLDDFLRMKAERFRQQGIDDPFASAGVRAFLDALATNSGTLELHALRVGDRTAAVFGGLSDNSRFCGLFTAFDADPAVSQWSPGLVLTTKLVADCCRRGLKTLDLGVGEARYKSQICNAEDALFDSVVPVSFKGRIAAIALDRFVGAKRRAKQSPAAGRAIAMLRRLKAGRGEPS